MRLTHGHTQSSNKQGHKSLLFLLNYIHFQSELTNSLWLLTSTQCENEIIPKMKHCGPRASGTSPGSTVANSAIWPPCGRREFYHKDQ